MAKRREHSGEFGELLCSSAMRSRALAWLLCALVLTACGSSQSGSEDAGETTAASSSMGTETSTGGDEEPGDCGTVTLTPEYTPPVVMYVVDTSSSMLAPWDHDGDPNTPNKTRWASARELVEQTADVIAPNSEHGLLAVLGLQRFPSADANACGVADAPEVPLGQQDATALLAAFPEPDELVAATPAAAGYANALAHVVVDTHEGSQKYMLLLTDGRENCDASEQLLALVADALVHDIYTFVIAIDEAADPALEQGPDAVPGFDPRPNLEALAQAGGTGSYYSASDPDAILQALQGPDEILECVIDLSQTPQGPPAPEQIELVTWTIDGFPIPYVEPEACDSQDGWTWLESGVVMTFCGQPCELMKHGIGALIEGRYGCPTER
jgi:hypothetical protein